MAIQKSKTLSSGVTGDYWRILNININRVTLKADVKLGLFKDKATSDAGGTDLGLVKCFSFDVLVSDLTMTTNLIAFIYTKIMAAASVTVNKDITGATIPDAPFDPDIAGGTPQ